MSLNRCLSLLILFSLFLTTHTTFADQTIIKNYNQSKDMFWELDYNQKGVTLYCNKKYSNKKGLNIEHVFAASWMKETSGCFNSNRKECRSQSPKFNRMEADLHNLFPANTKINSMRGDSTFGILIGTSDNECDLEIDNQTVEPPPTSRGPIARALLYMSHEYNVDLDKAADSNGLYDIALYWHCAYPVTQEEIDRNNTILGIQKTQNPFVNGAININCSKIRSFPED